MKKIIRVIPVIMAAVIIFTATSLSWMTDDNVIKFPTNFGGSAKTAYFESGDGSKENPYIISNPVHVYNLAWLQYLGYFNLGDYINNGRAQSFFRLEFDGDNMDLEGLCIPPIGTREYPFIGYFDGNGKTLSDLTVSNAKSDLVVRPLAAKFTDNNLDTTGTRVDVSVDILGLFGVTGDFNSFITDSEYASKKVVVDGKDTAVTVKGKIDGSESLIALPSGDVAQNELYYSGMNVHSFYVDKIRINSVSEKVLVGLAAGYVSSTIENVGVYRSKVSVSGVTGSVTDIVNAKGTAVTYDNVISNYSIVGDYDDSIVGWAKVPGGGSGTEPGDAAAWGGSVDMRTLNRRLTYISAKVITKKPTGYNFTAIDTDWGISFYRGSGSELYWNQQGSSYAMGYLNDGTILPLSVDKTEMGLDVDDETTNAVTGFHYNEYYKNNNSEIIGNKNTGYIVGDGSQKDGRIVTRVQPLACGQSPKERGVYKSLGLESSLNNVVLYNPDNFEMLTVVLNGDGSYSTYRIQDDVNKDKTNTSFDDITQKSYSALGFGGYAKVRENFDKTMDGAYMVHGFHFKNNVSENSYNKVSYIGAKIYDAEKNELMEYSDSGYDLIKGGINFTLSEDGSIKAILGAFYSGDYNSLFDLYEVKRSATGTITGVTRITDIYKRNSDGQIFYNLTGDTSDYTKIFSFEQLTKDCLQNGAAYYFEIPVTKGDYFIGADNASSENNAYLMYLDIGANGGDGSGGTTEELPYIMQSVDFVAMSTNDDGDTLTVPGVTAKTFPDYLDVGFRLSAVSDEIFYKRDRYDDLPTEGGAIETTVYYYRVNSAVIVTLISESSVCGTEDENKAKWS